MSIWTSAVSFVESAAKAADDIKPAVRTAGSLVDEVVGFTGRAIGGGVRVVGGAAKALTAGETGPAGVRAMKTAQGVVSVTKIPNLQRAIFGTAAVMGAMAGVSKGVKRDVRDFAQMSGVPTTFLSQQSIRRAYGYKDSRVRNDQSPQLGDLTLNLGNTSVLNKALKR